MAAVAPGARVGELPRRRLRDVRDDRVGVAAREAVGRPRSCPGPRPRAPGGWSPRRAARCPARTTSRPSSRRTVTRNSPSTAAAAGSRSARSSSSSPRSDGPDPVQTAPSNSSRSSTFQYDGSLRVDPQHLGALARPVERSVGVAPVEGDRLAGAELLRPGAVVEPRVVAVGGRGERDGARDRDRRARATPIQERRGSRSSQRKQTVSAASTTPSRTWLEPPIDTTGEATITSSVASDEEEVAAAALARPEGEQRRRAARAWRRAAGASAPATGRPPRRAAATVPSASAPLHSPLARSSHWRGLSRCSGSPEAA